MTPRHFIRPEGRVEAVRLTEDDADDVCLWLVGHGIDVERHAAHGLLLHTGDGLLRLDHGWWVTLVAGRVQTWDDRSFNEEHPQEVGR